jgi:predicted outer membrane repeat protein
VITDNHATGTGGGLATQEIGEFPVTIFDTVFSQNTAGQNGGALEGQHAVLTVEGCTFERNSASRGGAANVWLALGTFANCLFVGNMASFEGGGLAFSLADVDVRDCTFYDNSAPLGGAIENTSGDVLRTIIAFTTSAAPVTCVAPSVTFTCCNFFGNSGGFCGLDGGGNFSLDPLFCDPAGGDFRLHEDSPCLPGQHPSGTDCGGTIGALGVGCGAATSVDDRIEPASWSLVKMRYR